MSDLAFEELQSQVESLSYYQIKILQTKINSLLEKEESNRKSTSLVADGLAWLDKITGSIDRIIDYKKEREEWREEKYGRIN